MSIVPRFRIQSIVVLSALVLGTPARAQGIWGSIGEHKLKASDASASASLGEAIDVSGDRAIVTRLNALYVYELQAGAWVEVAKLLPVGGTPNNQFAHAAAISGDFIVAGAWLDDGAANDHGAAFVYERRHGHLNFVTKLTASDAGIADHFGWSIDMDGDSIPGRLRRGRPHRFPRWRLGVRVPPRWWSVDGGSQARRERSGHGGLLRLVGLDSR
jgi:hypothetical protein